MAYIRFLDFDFDNDGTLSKREFLRALDLALEETGDGRHSSPGFTVGGVLTEDEATALTERLTTGGKSKIRWEVRAETFFYITDVSPQFRTSEGLRLYVEDQPPGAESDQRRAESTLHEQIHELMLHPSSQPLCLCDFIVFLGLIVLLLFCQDFLALLSAAYEGDPAARPREPWYQVHGDIAEKVRSPNRKPPISMRILTSKRQHVPGIDMH